MILGRQGSVQRIGIVYLRIMRGMSNKKRKSRNEHAYIVWLNEVSETLW